MDKESVARSAGRLMEGRFTLDDFLEQLQQVKKMGSLSGMLSLLPGLPKELKQANAAIDDGQVAVVEAIIRSMTPAEREDPAVIDGSRRVRIARGSGTTTQDVNQLLKQFKEAQAMFRSPGMLGGLLGGLAGRGRMGKALESAMAGDMFGRGGAPLPPELAGLQPGADQGAAVPSRVELGGAGSGMLGLGGTSNGGTPSGARSKSGKTGKGGKGGKGGNRKKGGRTTPRGPRASG
jgi:signal recognition particle subunit SRP54